MIINPKVAIEKGWIKRMGVVGDVINKEQIQPNGIDLTLKGVAELVGRGVIGVTNEKRKICASSPIRKTYEGFYELEARKAYSLSFNEFVEIPENVAALIIHRSSLNRCGCYVLSGLYDSGFRNFAGAYAHPWNDLLLEQDARIAQIVFIKAENADMYNGVYKKVD